MLNSRRQFLRALGLAITCVPFNNVFSKSALSASALCCDASNFRYIYGKQEYKNQFYDFLSNVFHLFPEDELHQLISKASEQSASDEEIYQDLQQKVESIQPFLAAFTYAIPALKKQKQVMAKQTHDLLPNKKQFEGYLEVGSTGRYLDALEEVLNIQGDVYYLSDLAPTYSLQDLIDRGQIAKGGEFINLQNYSPKLTDTIPENSIDLATVFIGFHHCPIELREEFITSIRDVMKPGASLILRDHNAHNEKMWKMVALAHDVFNMGTNESWNYNARELRNFYSLDILDKMLTHYGFQSSGERLYQEGDPTLNALMHYKKA